MDFVDVHQLGEATGHDVRARWRRPGEPGSLPPADAVVVAPATYNTINKCAAGIADVYALGQLAEAVGRGLPSSCSPSSTAPWPPTLRMRAAFRRCGPTAFACSTGRPTLTASAAGLNPTRPEPAVGWKGSSRGRTPSTHWTPASPGREQAD